MKKYFIAIILIMIVVVTFYSIFHKFIRPNNSATISQNSHSGDREEQQADTIEYGLYSLDGKYIDNGSTIYPEDDEANMNISINHNLNERREYSLIVLEDFKQVSFKLKNKQEFIKYLLL
ncbi:hypothetical protein F3K44_32350 [Bacillus megaterium]|nr:hypothetical protein [Priestia megaterium]